MILPVVWAALIAFAVLAYVLLDGFDLGVGILFGLTRDETRRRAMLSAVAPMWDGNETWLVVAGVVLWGAFPVVYATLFSAFYLPLLLMLAGDRVLHTQIERILGLLVEVRGVVKCIRDGVTRREF